MVVANGADEPISNPERGCILHSAYALRKCMHSTILAPDFSK